MCGLCRIGNIVNVTLEIDNFFPGMFDYCNVRVTDEETTDIMRYWQSTYDFISAARSDHSAFEAPSLVAYFGHVPMHSAIGKRLHCKQCSNAKR